MLLESRLNLSLDCEGEAAWWWTAGEKAGHAAGLKKFAGSHGKGFKDCLLFLLLGFGVKHLLSLPLLGRSSIIQFEEHVFQMVWFNRLLVWIGGRCYGFESSRIFQVGIFGDFKARSRVIRSEFVFAKSLALTQHRKSCEAAYHSMIQSLSFSSIGGFCTSNFQSLLGVTKEHSEFFFSELYWSQRISLVISEVFHDYFGYHFLNYEVIPWGATLNSFASLTCFFVSRKTINCY